MEQFREPLRILVSGRRKLYLYTETVEAAGAVAVGGEPPALDLSCDGLLLCGGTDMDPAYYGQEINGSRNIDNELDALEWELTDAFVKAGKPILGICRGHQFLNVFFGGTLHQHLQDAHLHTDGQVHTLEAVGEFWGNTYGPRFVVNSFHHQGVDRLGEGLVATALHGEMVESFAHESLPVFGVQWHPERMCYSRKREDTCDGAPVFERFFQMCRKG